MDDGAILVVGKDDRTVRIEEVITPSFRQQDFAGGILSGLQRMMGVIDGGITLLTTWIGIAELLYTRYGDRGGHGGGIKGGGGGFGGVVIQPNKFETIPSWIHPGLNTSRCSLGAWPAMPRSI